MWKSAAVGCVLNACLVGIAGAAGPFGSVSTGNWIGGAFVHRDHKGDKSNRAPIEAVPAAVQRNAAEFARDEQLDAGRRRGRDQPAARERESESESERSQHRAHGACPCERPPHRDGPLSTASFRRASRSSHADSARCIHTAAGESAPARRR